MFICYNPTLLQFIMYFKYVTILLFICLIFVYVKDKSKMIVKKCLVFDVSLILLFLVAGILLNVFDVDYKDCFNNSNNKRINYAKKITKAYNEANVVNTTDEYVNKISPKFINKLVNGKTVYLFNQNQFPLSNYEFTFNNSYYGYNFKQSGNEISTLASILSLIIDEELTDPLQVLEILESYDFKVDATFDMDLALQLLAYSYEFNYKKIDASEMTSTVKKGGIVLIKTTGNENGTIFSCTEGYILVYDVDKSGNLSLISSNDKDYEYICPVKTKGFGNIIKANLNSKTYSLEDVVANSEIYYSIWR